jgi:anti-anti-sigma factor
MTHAQGTGETFRLDRKGEHVRLIASGELDLNDADAFCEGLVVLSAAGSTVEVDLSEVTFIDASSVDLIMHAATDAKDDGTDMTVVGASPSIAHVIELCGAGSLLS